jgi:hypothetical protein
MEKFGENALWSFRAPAEAGFGQLAEITPNEGLR